MRENDARANGIGVRELVWLGARPRTLTMAAVPVIAGASLAWSRGVPPALLTFAMTLACAVLIQVGTNLFNDAGDGARGADGPDRIGPPRLTGAGLATVGQVRTAAMVSFGAALAAGIYLALVGGMPIVTVGVASLLAGYAYSSGPAPISYRPWGEVYVIAFFGVVAVAGSYYLQTPVLPDWRVVATGIAIGMPSAAVLLVNNVRDLVPDRRAGRCTLAILLGARRARWIYAALMLAPFALLAIAFGAQALGVVWFALPYFAWLAVRFFQAAPGAMLNRQLGSTALAQVMLGALLVTAWLR